MLHYEVYMKYTVPVIKKLKYSTAGTERVRSRFARGSLEVRSWCANRYGAGAVRCGAHALRSYAGATPIVYAYILTAVENYPLLRVVGEDPSRSPSNISPWPREHAMRYN